MLKLSRNALGMLIAKYRTILQNMFCNNCSALRKYSAALLTSFLLLCASPAMAATYVVGGGDPGGGVIYYNNLEELRIAVSGNFQTGDTIKIQTDDRTLTAALNLNKANVTIDFGNNAVTIQPKTIPTGGSAVAPSGQPNSGWGYTSSNTPQFIQNSGTVTFENAKGTSINGFSNASYTGGTPNDPPSNTGSGIQSQTGDISVGTGMTFSNNFASWGAAVYAATGSVSVSGDFNNVTTFSGNRASTHSNKSSQMQDYDYLYYPLIQGGAIYAAKDVTINGYNIFQSNEARQGNFDASSMVTSGGAVYAGNNVNVTGSNQFNNNYVTYTMYYGYGGAIYAGNIVSIDGTNSFKNNASGTLEWNKYIPGGTDPGGSWYHKNLGGAIYAAKGIDIKGANYFSTNQANNGGAIYSGGDKEGTTVGYVNISGYGTNPNADDTVGNVFINNKVKSNDSMFGSAGGAVAATGDVDVSGTNRFEGNSSSAYSSNAGGLGGAIYSNGDVTLTEGSNSTFVNNTAGSTTVSVDKFTVALGAWLNMEKPWGAHNAPAFTGTAGGAIFAANNVNIINGNNIFSGNAVYNYSSGYYFSKGGAIYGGTGVTVNGGNEFSTNTAKLGGAIYSDGIINISSDSSSSYNIFTSNTALAGESNSTAASGGHGGAVYGGSDINVQGLNKFTQNSANAYDGSYGNHFGGAIYGAGTVYISGSNSFSKNVANGKGAYSGGGGAVYGKTAVNVTGANTFDSNYATGGSTKANIVSGGAIYSAGDVTVTGDNNTVNTVYNSDGITVHDTVVPLVFGNVFSNNYLGNAPAAVNGAPAYGGAIYGNTVTIKGSNYFYNNYLTDLFMGTKSYINNGGAIYGVGTVDISSGAGGINVFEQNAATQFGGAIYGGGKITISGTNQFINNTATTNGGAIYANDDLTITADTGDIIFKDNTIGSTFSSSNATYLDKKGTAYNAIYMGTANKNLTLGANDGKTIYFYDPLAANSTQTVNINLNANATTGINTGTVFFDGKNTTPSGITVNINAATTVGGGTVQLANGAIYGSNSSSTSSFKLNSGANLMTDATGNTVQAKTITFDTGSKLSFDMANATGSTINLNLIGTVANPSGGGTINIIDNSNWLNVGTTYKLINTSTPTNNFSYWNKLEFDGKSSDKDRTVTLYKLTSDTNNLYLSKNEGLTNSTDLKWTGTGSTGAWENFGALNWIGTVNNSQVSQFMDGDTVLFDDSATGTRDITITGNVKVVGMTVNNSNSSNKSYTFSGPGNITGSFDMLKTGTGTLTLNTANTYIGNTQLQGGRLNIGNQLALGGNTNSLIMSNATTLGFNGSFTGSNAIGNAVTIKDSGKVTIDVGGNYEAVLKQGINSEVASNKTTGFTKTGSGTLSLGKSSTVGTATIDAGTLDLGSGVSLTADNVTFKDNTTLSLNVTELSLQTNNLSIGGNTTLDITTFDTEGADSQLTEQILVTANAIAGAFSNVLVGGVSVSAGTSLNSYINIDPSAYRTTTNDGKIAIAIKTGGLVWNNSSPSSAHGTFNVATNFVLKDSLSNNNAVISAGGGFAGWDGKTLTKTGAGTLTFDTTSKNTYTGNTYITGGTLALTSVDNLKDTGNEIHLENGATLQFNYSGTLNKELYLGNGGGTINTSGNTDDLSGIIFNDQYLDIYGSGSLTKTGTGTLKLQTQNFYTGDTNVKEGTLILADKDALGPSGSLKMSSGTKLDFANSNMIFNNNTTLAGQVTVNVDNPLYETLTGVISNGESAGTLIKTGGGTLSLKGTNTYSGGTNLKQGTIEIITDKGLGDGTLTADGNTILDFANDSTDNRTTIGNAVVLNGSVTIATGDANSNFTATIGGVVSGSGGITKTDDGTLALSNQNNAYTGGTNLNKGTIAVGSNKALGTGALNAAGGKLDFTANNLTLSNAINLNGTNDITINVGVNSSNLYTETLSGVISGNKGIDKTGVGTLVLSGNNSYTGGTDISAGTLTVGNNSALGTGGVNLSDATLGFNGSYTINNNVALSGNTSINVSGASVNATIAGAVTGGDLNKMGTGALTLTNDTSPNTYANTNIKEGTLNIAGNSAIGSGAITMSSGTTLGFTNAQSNYTIAQGITINSGGTINVAGSSTTTTVTGAITGGGSLAKTGTGTLIIRNSANTGGVSASGGTLNVDGAAGILTAIGNATISNGAALSATNNGDIDINGNATASGSGSKINADGNGSTIDVTGNATLSSGASLSATNNGDITITVGAVVSGSGSAINADGIGSTIDIGGNVALNNGAALNATGGGKVETEAIDNTTGNAALIADGDNSAITVGSSLANKDVTINGDNSMVSANAKSLIDINGNLNIKSNNSVVSATNQGIINAKNLGVTGNYFSLNLIGGSKLNVNSITNNGTGATVTMDNGNSILVGAGGNISLGDSSSLTMGNNNTISAGGSLSTGNNSNLTAGNQNTVSADGGLSTGDNSVWAFGSNTNIETNGGDINIGNNSTLTMADNANGSAFSVETNGGDIKISDGSTLSIGNNMNVDTSSTTKGGDISIGNSSALILGSNTDLSANNMTTGNNSLLSLDSDSSITLDGNLTLSADNTTGLDVNNFDLSTTSSGNVILIEVDGDITGRFGTIKIGGVVADSAATTPTIDNFIVGGGVSINTAVPAGTPKTVVITHGGLAWNYKDDSSKAHGTFNVATNYTLNSVLADRYNGINGSDADNFTSGLGGWNGKELTKTGAGTLTLAAANTYSGGTILEQGKLVIGVDSVFAGNNITSSAIGTGALTMKDGTTLGFTNSDTTVGNAIAIANGIATVEVTGDLDTTNATLKGIISGNTGSLTKTGGGMLTISGTNTYKGGTFLNQGGININSNKALGDGNLTTSGGTTLAFNGGANAYSIDNKITLNGGTTFDVDKAADNTNLVEATIANTVDGDGSITKTGDGTLILKGANTYTGGTVLNDGIISFGQSSVVDNTTGTIISGAIGTGTLTVNDGGTFVFANDASNKKMEIANAIILNAPDTDINVGGTLADPFIDTLSGSISGTGGITKTGEGTLILSGNNSYTGATNLDDGTIAAGSNNALGASVLNAGDGILDFAKDGLNLSNTINLTGDDLNVNVDGDTDGLYTETLSGVISGNNGINKTGDGTLILAAHSTYTGDTNLAEGTIKVGTNSKFDESGDLLSGALGTGDLNISSTATFGVDGNFIVGNDITITGDTTRIEVGSGGTATLTGEIAGGDLNKLGDGTLVLKNSHNDYGDTNLQKGAITVGGDYALGDGDFDVLNMSNGTTLNFGGDFTIGNDVNILPNAGNTSTATINDGGNADAVIEGTVSGNGNANSNLVKTGDGTLTVDSVDVGSLNVDRGNLIILDELKTTGDATLGNGADLTLNTGISSVGDNNTNNNTIGGKLILSADNATLNANGGSIISINGEVTVSGDGNSLNADGSNITNGSTININDNVTVSGDSNSLNATNGGIININGDGTAEGDLIVDSTDPANPVNGFVLNADGSGSEINIADDLVVIAGNANMNATGGGLITVGGDATVKGSGSTLGAGAGGALDIVGKVSLDQGAALTAKGGGDVDTGSVELGENSSVNADGAGSVIEIDGQVSVTGNGDSLNAIDGGVININGDGLGIEGDLIVKSTDPLNPIDGFVLKADGSGSKINIADDLIVTAGNANMSATGGGLININGDATVTGSGSTLGAGAGGALDVNGKTKLDQGAALIATGGGQVDTGDVELGENSSVNANGTDASHNGSSITIAGNLDITGNGADVLATDGGIITADNLNIQGNNALVQADEPGSMIDIIGKLNITGNGDGAKVLATDGGDITVGSMDIAGNDALVQADESGSTIDIIGKLNITGNGADVLATDDGDITVGSMDIGGDNAIVQADKSGSTIGIDSNLNITGNEADVFATNGGVITVGTVGVGGNITISGNDSTLGTDGLGSEILVKGDVTVSGDGDSVKANDNSIITINGKMDVTATGDDFTLEAKNNSTIEILGSGGLNVDDENTGFTLNLDNGTLDITNGSIYTGDGSEWNINNGTITAGGDIKAGDDSVINVGDSLVIDAGGGLSTGNNSTLTQTGEGADITTGIGGIKTGDNSHWTLGNDTTIDTNNGDINIGTNSTLTIGDGSSVETDGGDIIVGNKGELTLGIDTDLHADNMTLNNGSTLSLDASSDVELDGKLTIGTPPISGDSTAGGVTLDVHNLGLTNDGSAGGGGTVTENLIITQDGIDGMFGKITLGGEDVGAGSGSFVSDVVMGKSEDGNTIQVSYTSLAWYEESAKAHGNFNVSTKYTLSSQLRDRYAGTINGVTDTFTSGIDGWDGKTLTKDKAGNLTLSGNNSYSGGTNLKGGTITVGNNNALGTSQLRMNTGTTLGFNGNGYTIANDIILNYNFNSSGSYVGSSTNGSASFDVGGNGSPYSAVITGNISDGSDAAHSADLHKTGKGELILSGQNTYRGNTYIDAGTLTITNQQALSSGVLNIGNETTFSFADATGKTNPAGNKYSYDFRNSVFIGDNINSFINVGGSDSTIAWIVNGINGLKGSGNSYSGKFTKTGGGTLLLGTSNVGSVEVAEGILGISGGNNLNTTGDVTVTGGDSTLSLGFDGGSSSLNTNGGNVLVDDGAVLGANNGSLIDTGGGSVTVNDESKLNGGDNLTIYTDGGNVLVDYSSELNGGKNSLIDTTTGTNIDGGSVTVDHNSAINLGDGSKINTGGGDVNVDDNSNMHSDGGLTINTGGGDPTDGDKGGSVNVDNGSTLDANEKLNINTGGGNVNVGTDFDNDGDGGNGHISGGNDSTINTAGGSINVGNNSDITLGNDSDIKTGSGGVNVIENSELNGGNNLTIDTDGGNILVDYTSELNGGKNSVIDTTTGNSTPGGSVTVDHDSDINLGDGSKINTGGGGVTVDNESKLHGSGDGNSDGNSDGDLTIDTTNPNNPGNGGDVVVNNDSTLDADGKLNINTGGGKVIVDDTTPYSGNGSKLGTDDKLTIDTDGGKVIVDNGSEIDGGDNSLIDTSNGVKKGGDVTVDNGSTINLGAGSDIYTGGGNIDVTNSGQTPDNGSTLEVGDGSTIDTSNHDNKNTDGGNITVDNDSTLIAGDGSKIITGGGNVNVDNDSELHGKGDLTIDTRDNDGNPNTPGGDVNVDNGSTLDADGKLNINTGGGDVNVGTDFDNDGDGGNGHIIGGNGSEINTGGGDVTVDNNSNITLGDDSKIDTGGGNVNVDNDSELHGKGDLTIDTRDNDGNPNTPGGDVNVDNGSTLDADGKLDINTGGGDVNVGTDFDNDGDGGNGHIKGGDGSKIDTDGGEVNVDNKSDITLGDDSKIDTTTNDGTDGGEVNVENESKIILGDDSEIITGGGDVNVDDKSNIHGGGNLTIDTSGGDPTDGDKGGKVNVDNGSTIDADGKLNINTGGGDVNVGTEDGGSHIIGGDGSEINTGGGDINVGRDTDPNDDIDNGSSIDLGDNSNINTGGGDIHIGDNSDVSVGDKGKIDTGDGKGNYGDITIDDNASIDVGDGGKIDTGNIGDDINKGNNSSVTGGDNSELNTGNITLGDNSKVAIGDNSKLTSKNITVGDNSTIGAGKNSNILAKGDITMGKESGTSKETMYVGDNGTIHATKDIIINGNADFSIGVGGKISAGNDVKINGEFDIDISAYDPSFPSYTILEYGGQLITTGIDLTVGGSSIAESSNVITEKNFLYEPLVKDENGTFAPQEQITYKGSEVVVNLGKLAWDNDEKDNTGNIRAHGTFNIGKEDEPERKYTFTLFEALHDRTDLNGGGWDGKTLTKEGTGNLILSANNQYSGGTKLKEGGIYAAHNSALGTKELIMSEGTTFGFFQPNSALNISNNIVLGSASSSGPRLFADLSDYNFDILTDGTISGEISGDGTLNKTGQGILTLTGANTYTGTTKLNTDAGGIVIGNNLALGKSNLVMSNQTVIGFGGNYTIANNIDIVDDAKAYINTAGNTDTIGKQLNDGQIEGGQITFGSGSTLVKTGYGTLNLTNTDTNYENGTLDIQLGNLNVSVSNGKTFNNIINNSRLNFVHNEGDDGRKNINIKNYDVSSTGVIGITASATNTTSGLWTDRLIFDNDPVKVNVQFNFKPGSSIKNLAARGEEGLVFATLTGNNNANENAFNLSGAAFLSGAYELNIKPGELGTGLDSTSDTDYLVWAKYNPSAGKVYSEASAASLGQASGMYGLKLFESLSKAAADANGAENSTGVFVGYSNSDIRHDTGSHADVKGNNFTIAAAWKKGKTAYGIFGQKFDGSYTTTNDAAISSGTVTINSNGDLKSQNIGLFVEIMQDGQKHGEQGRYYMAQLSTGHSSNDFRSYNAAEGSSFHSKRRMIGGSIGGGLIKNSGNDRTTEYYSHLIGTGLYSDNVTDSLGQRITFKGSKSVRLLSGMRISLNKTQKTSSYFGAALDYEFNGKSDAYVDGNKALGASLKGLTGILETGISFKRSETLTIDLGLQGYLGKKRGFSGNLLLRKAF